MKKFFTLIAAVAMAASVSAQTPKAFTANTYWKASKAAVSAAVTEGWVAAEAVAADNKKGNINPETRGDVGEGKYKDTGIDVKLGNSTKVFKAYITGVSNVEVYGVTTSSSDSRAMLVTAIPTAGGDAISASEVSAPSNTAVVKLALDKATTYELEVTGVKSDDAATGADIAVHGIWFLVDGTNGISNIKASEAANEGATFNLLGQKVASNAKGLVIKNGKKFINK